MMNARSSSSPQIETNDHLIQRALDFTLHNKVSPFWPELGQMPLPPLLSEQNEIVMDEGAALISRTFGIPIETVTEDRANWFLATYDGQMGPAVQDYIQRFDDYKCEFTKRALSVIAAMTTNPGPSQLAHLRPFPTKRKRMAIWKKLHDIASSPILKQIVESRYGPSDDHCAYVERCRSLFAELRKLKEKEVEDWMEFSIFMTPLIKEAAFKPYVRYITYAYLKLSLIDVYSKFIVYEHARKGNIRHLMHPTSI